MKQLFATLAILMLSTIAQAQKTYPLYCRGGGDIYTNNGVSFRPYADSGGLYIEVEIDITQGTDYKNLLPGQCSWGDRAMRSTEPSSLHLWTNELPTVSVFPKSVADGTHRPAIEIVTTTNQWWLPPAINNGFTETWAWPDTVNSTNLDDGSVRQTSILSPLFYIKLLVYNATPLPYFQIQGWGCSSYPGNRCW